MFKYYYSFSIYEMFQCVKLNIHFKWFQVNLRKTMITINKNRFK